MEVEYKTKYNSSYNLKMKTSIFVFSLKPVHEEQNCVICVKF